MTSPRITELNQKIAELQAEASLQFEREANENLRRWEAEERQNKERLERQSETDRKHVALMDQKETERRRQGERENERWYRERIANCYKPSQQFAGLGICQGYINQLIDSEMYQRCHWCLQCSHGKSNPALLHMMEAGQRPPIIGAW